ncbi:MULTISPECIES: hypothetical protein [Clostridium]|uniref:hypothetical protein n=1 Tax=Clostridium TaxID=1485 RepID=UPI0008267522|nr:MULTISPECIES: hypothetical protein [Clostridium]PJI08095.1 hypothetical protein CUB90_09545 [Clostridium sp. CT7]
MLKLIKYEFKTIYREFLLVMLISIALNIGLMTRVNVWENGAIIALSVLILTSICVATFIMSIRIFVRDLKRDTKYLIFTVPKSGYSIIGEKLICSLVMMILSLIVGGCFLLNFAYTLGAKISFSQIFDSRVIFYTIFGLMEYIGTLIIIYFSILLARMITKNGRFSGILSLGVFVAFNWIWFEICKVIDKLFPQQIVFNNVLKAFTVSSVKVTVHAGGPSIFVVSTILEFILAIILFVISVKILDEKMDL